MGDAASTDTATEENMRNLVEIGNELTKKCASRFNRQTGSYEGESTPEEALTIFAKRFSGERKLRLAS
ncbi:hypothetical protein V6N13_064784 [Hibiscus sabdariffa]|uniref:Uncharacterized protein n=1 Tax=Hibiscus sabdariffa TaxID=183260 RepID=A0ABR2ECL0_9ROSI